MDSKKSNKIREIVRLQQILKKWKKLANASKNAATNNPSTTNNGSGGGSKSIKFLKKTLSFSESTYNSNSTMSNDIVPKGFLAVCVGKDLKRFVIPTEYLAHQAFGILLREAEEEFGFQQEGVLKIPCELSVFEKILKMMEQKSSNNSDHVFFLHDQFDAADDDQNDMFMGCYSSPDTCELTSSHHVQMCR